MPPKIAKLAGLGAFGVVAGIVVVYVLIVIGTWPRHPSVGMLPTLAVLVWIAIGLVFLALIATHIVIARQLLYIGKGGGPRKV
jgi:hypothetical protein